MNNSDPLELLKQLNKKYGFEIEDNLIEKCYLIQKEHQFDKDRITMKKMEQLIEESLLSKKQSELL